MERTVPVTAFTGCPLPWKARGASRGSGAAPRALSPVWACVLLVFFLLLPPVAGGGRASAASPPRVALTFDDGYGLDHRILEFLSSQGISATAFVIGSWAQRNPALLQEMDSLGWDVCNHTQNHPYLTRLQDAQIVAELNACQAVIGSITGQYLPLFRPPGGYLDARVQGVAASAGYTPVMWDLDCGDSRGTDYPVPERIAYLVNAARDGSIILFHFGGRHTYETLVGVVQGLQRRGFCFVTISELYGWKDLVRGGDTAPGLACARRQYFFAEGTTRPGFEEWIAIFNPGTLEAEVELDFHSAGGNMAKKYRVPPRRRVTLWVNGEFPGKEDVSVSLNASVGVIAERALYFRLGNGFSGGFTSAGVQKPRRLYYFPELTLGDDFQVYLAVFNPGGIEAEVELEFVKGSETRKETISVPGNLRATVGLNSLMPAGEYSLVVRSGVPLAVERSTYYAFNGVITGASCTAGEESPRSEWFFAEGTTRDFFHSFLVLYNPCRYSSWARVRLEVAGGLHVEENVLLGAGERKTVYINDCLPPSADYSLRVESLLPVLVERSVYFKSQNVVGGTCTTAVPAPEKEWFFAEGCTAPGYSEWLAIYNPLEGEQEVEVTYYPGGDPVHRRYPVPPRGRVTIDVAAEVGRVSEVAMEVHSPGGVVTERSVYFERNTGN